MRKERHEFGILLNQYLRRQGLSQSRLVDEIEASNLTQLYTPSSTARSIPLDARTVSQMCYGQHLTSPDTRPRILAMIHWLHHKQALATCAEANSLLRAAGLAGLNPHHPCEVQLRDSLIQSASVQSCYSEGVDHASRELFKNLPLLTTSFIGREKELEAVCHLLARADVCLVTLTGAGGSGKTRLALHVAATLASRFHDGGAFVSLALIRDPGLVAPTIAQTLGLQVRGDQSVLELLKAYLREKQLLLILDNCEHLQAAADLVIELLARAVQIKVLVTSREALHLQRYGESVFSVEPLAVPTLEHGASAAAVRQAAAVQLFLERAQEVDPAFALTDANAAAVAELCLRVGGLPLAIELLSAWVTVLTPQEIAARIERHGHLPLLQRRAGPGHSVPERQRTMRATIGWSYDLLNPAEQALFAQVALFEGGWTLEALEAICTTETTQYVPLLEVLAGLIDKHLVQRIRQPDGSLRFSMLEPVREYALERLAERDDETRLRQSYATYYLHLAESAEAQLHGPKQQEALERLERDRENLRAALHWAVDQGLEELGLRLAGSLWRWWDTREHVQEGSGWLEQVLTLTHEPASQYRVKALVGAATLAYQQGDYPQARALYEEGLTLSQRVEDTLGHAAALCGLGMVAKDTGDYAQAEAWVAESLCLYRAVKHTVGIAEALNQQGILAVVQGNYDQAVVCYQESLTLFRAVQDTRQIAYVLSNWGLAERNRGNYAQSRAHHEESLALRHALGDTWGIAYSLANLGILAQNERDFEKAVAYQEQSLALFRQLGHTWGIGLMLCMLAQTAQYAGEYDYAARLATESLAIFTELKNPWSIAMAHYILGMIAQYQGDSRRALALSQESMRLRQDLGDQHGIAESLEAAAGALAALGQPEHAWKLVGAATALRAEIGAPRSPAEQADLERRLAPAHPVFTEEAVATAVAEGQALTREEAIALALVAGEGGDVPKAAQCSTHLTEREQEVLRLVEQGKTNKQIAAILGISEKTIKRHIENILTRFAVHNRTAAAYKARSMNLL